MQETQKYIEQHQDRFLEELMEWLRIPSVSADPQYKGDVQRAAAFLKEKLEKAGVDKAEIYPTAGHPIVYAEKLVHPDLPDGHGVRALRCSATRSHGTLGVRPL
jgi:acetylornithine deacetylase/succinyl-diaminopimelate desuccinylase-like protein